MPSVSVIIPTFERPEKLPGAIETALGQSLADIEVIVVDDGSETTYAKDFEETDDRIRVITHERNRGAAAARNTGIEAARGEYLAFLDDDDRWHREKLARQVSHLEAVPEDGIVTTRMCSVTPTGEPITCEATVASGDRSEAALVGNPIGSPSRILLRTSTLGDHRFREDLETKHDWELFLRLCQETTVGAIQEPHYVRIEHEGISSDPHKSERDQLAVLDIHEELIRQHGVWSNANARVHCEVARRHLDAGNRIAALRHCRISLGHTPSKRALELVAWGLLPGFGFRGILGLKRWFERHRRNCPMRSRLQTVVPGFPDGD